MSTIMFTIQGTPTGKARARTVHVNGVTRSFTPAKTKRAEDSLLAQALPYKPDTPWNGPLSVAIVAVFPVPASYPKKRRAACLSGEEMPAKKPDVDNIGKLVIDALNGVFFIDDAQIVDMRLVKCYGETPQVSVALQQVCGVRALAAVGEGR